VVKNISGGAVIFYTLPSDDDLVGVKALYSYHEGSEILEAYSSAYTDSITLVGFPDTRERTVKLIAFNKSRQESDPVEVTINPLTIPVEVIRNSLDVSETFNGILVKWQNPNKADIGVSLYVPDSLGFMKFDYTHFSRGSGHYAFRGYENKERKFRIVIRDRWGNTATPLDTLLTPIFEEDVVARAVNGRTTWIRYGYDDKTTLWRGDYPSTFSTAAFWMMFDESSSTASSYLNPGLPETFQLSVFTDNKEDEGIWQRPMYLTIDMTRETKLSRYKLYGRGGQSALNMNDPYHIRIWASNETPKGPDDFEYQMESLRYWTNWPLISGTDAWKNDWTLVGESLMIPPSGATDAYLWTAEDIRWEQSGVEFDFFSEHSNTPFRYLRIECIETLFKLDLAQMHFHLMQVFGSVHF